MIIDDLDVVGVTVPPCEADPPLVVDANGILVRPVAAQLFQSVAGNVSKVIETAGSVEGQELVERTTLDVARNSLERPPKRFAVSREAKPLITAPV